MDNHTNKIIDSLCTDILFDIVDSEVGEISVDVTLVTDDKSSIAYETIYFDHMPKTFKPNKEWIENQVSKIKSFQWDDNSN